MSQDYKSIEKKVPIATAPKEDFPKIY